MTDRTLEIWAPSPRWTPAQCIHNVIPKLIDAHSGSTIYRKIISLCFFCVVFLGVGGRERGARGVTVLGAVQSAQRLFPSWLTTFKRNWRRPSFVAGTSPDIRFCFKLNTLPLCFLIGCKKREKGGGRTSTLRRRVATEVLLPWRVFCSLVFINLAFSSFMLVTQACRSSKVGLWKIKHVSKVKRKEWELRGVPRTHRSYWLSRLQKQILFRLLWVPQSPLPSQKESE